MLLLELLLLFPLTLLTLLLLLLFVTLLLLLLLLSQTATLGPTAAASNTAAAAAPAAAAANAAAAAANAADPLHPAAHPETWPPPFRHHRPHFWWSHHIGTSMVPFYCTFLVILSTNTLPVLMAAAMPSVMCRETALQHKGILSTHGKQKACRKAY